MIKPSAPTFCIQEDLGSIFNQQLDTPHLVTSNKISNGHFLTNSRYIIHSERSL
jgi:hypothetical protein